MGQDASHSSADPRFDAAVRLVHRCVARGATIEELDAVIRAQALAEPRRRELWFEALRFAPTV